MGTLMEERIATLTRNLGELLVGADGASIASIAHLRAERDLLRQRAEDEVHSTAALRNGNRDVAGQKKGLKACESALREACSHVDAVADKLGEQLCECQNKGLLSGFSDLDVAQNARKALNSLRSDYDNLDPGPKAGLWARGKAAAQRVLVSGKFLFRKSKQRSCNAQRPKRHITLT